MRHSYLGGSNILISFFERRRRGCNILMGMVAILFSPLQEGRMLYSNLHGSNLHLDSSIRISRDKL